MKLLKLEGYKALKALNGFNALLLGLKMLPAYIEEDYKSFFARFQDMTEAEKESMLRQAVAFVQLEKDEVEAIITFACDANGIAYTPVNMGKLSVKDLHEIIVAVCMDIGRIKIDLVSEEEKKNSQPGQ